MSWQMDHARAPSRRRMRPISLITVTNSTASFGATRYSISTTTGPDAACISTVGGVSSTRARGSSEPSCSTATRRNRATTSETSAVQPATVSDSRRPATLASSPHHQLPSAIEAKVMVW